MFKKMRLYKKILIVVIAIAALFVYLYDELLRPALIFHTDATSDGKQSIVLRKEYLINGEHDSPFFDRKLAANVNGDRIKYRLPYQWDWWDDEREIVIYIGRRYNGVFKKEDVNFWRMDIFIDGKGYYVNHSTTEYFWPLNKKGTRPIKIK